MFFEGESPSAVGERSLSPDETCAECGEVVFAGMMPRHFAKDHARIDESYLAAMDLAEEGQPPVSPFVLEARTRPFAFPCGSLLRRSN